MRKKLMMTALFFVLMAALPLTILLQNGKAGAPPPSSGSQDSAADDAAIALTAQLCDSSFSDEAIRALAIVQKTNAAAGYRSGQAEKEVGAALSERVKRIYISNTELLTYENKPVAVPCSLSSNGCTVEEEDYPYLDAVASPWDAFRADYRADNACLGVSAAGVDYLCRQGLSAEEALQWYLPRLTAA